LHSENLKSIDLKRILLILTLILFINQGFGQKNPMPIGQIYGSLIDSLTNTPVDYATIALYKLKDKKLITGTLTKTKGKFNFESVYPGKYYMQISFMGYKEVTINDIIINMANPIVDLGKIFMQRSVQNLEEVVIDGSAPGIEYKIDKKIINVSKQITATSGTAVDILETVPSINVDIEGNVSLRGSTGFTVLIDGRPSILDPNDALLQIPASTIDNIEIITNPSVKYDPDGTAGIINIITKKNKLQGVSGIINLNAGLDKKYGGDFLVNLKDKKFNYYIGGDYNIRKYPGERILDRTTSSGDSLFHVNSNGTFDRERNTKSIRAGTEFQMNEKNFFSLGFKYGTREGNGDSRLDYEEWTEPGNNINHYKNIEESHRGGDYISINTNYGHKFSKKGHEILTEFSYDIRNWEDNSISELETLGGEITDGIKNVEDGPSRRIRTKVDYTLPIGETNKFEAGYQSRLGKREDNSELYYLNLATKDYEIQSDYSHKTNYARNIHSLYTLYAGEIGNFGYQGGLRGEYTWRNIESTGESMPFTIERWDLFPTLHLSYNLPKDNQVMGSYARRIDRPRGWYLEPFLTWTDAYNVRQGNPDLQPEYIDSYEITYLKKFDKNFISLESYYRITHNKIERVNSVYSENVMLSTIENVGEDYSLGIEFMLSYKLFKWWQADLLGNFYRYKVEGILYDVDFSNESNNWSSRFNNTFSIKKNTKIQLNSSYNGPSANAQGRSEGYYTLNAAVRQDLFDKKFSAVLQLRDVFGTAKHEFTSEGPDFISHSEYNRKAPVLTLTLTYRFNNYRPDRKKTNGKDMENGDGADF